MWRRDRSEHAHGVDGRQCEYGAFFQRVHCNYVPQPGLKAVRLRADTLRRRRIVAEGALTGDRSRDADPGIIFAAADPTRYNFRFLSERGVMDHIQIKGARTHNLKNIELAMPRDKLNENNDHS